MVYAQIHLLLIFISLAFFLRFDAAQLVVNVKNKGGDVVKETILSNTTNDLVQLEFQNTDGTLITQFIDFKSETQIFRAYVLWEEEQGFVHSKPQVLCFVNRFNKNEFISSDAMSKLRQKNPTAIRSPEEEKVPEIHLMDMQLDIEKADLISPHIYNICQEARESIAVKESDLRIWSRALGRDLETLVGTGEHTYPGKYTNCKEITNVEKPCLCHYQICVGWYPCGLKYCRGKDSTGRYVTYRCGIKTCRRFLSYDYVARQKLYCLWDDVS